MSKKDNLNINQDDLRIPSKDDFVVQFNDANDMKVTAIKKRMVDDAPQGTPEDMVGRVLDKKYLLMKKLGDGGMGSVYLAKHTVIEKRVAVKVLHPHLSAKSNVAERFVREAKAASKIHHENVVDVSDYGVTPEGIIYIVMEFLEGRELRQVMDDTGAMPFARAKHITLQIARALCAAHKQNIVHRDIKPANIFLIDFAGDSDFVKIIDFGIAKVARAEGSLTKTGTIMGTPDYMSPEQAAGKEVGPGTDIYSTGIILYELLTGTVPFDADSFMGVLTKHMFEKPLSPSQQHPDGAITKAMDNVVLKALAKKAQQRYHSMEQFIEALKAISEDGAGPVVKLADEEPSSGHGTLLAVSVIILFLIAAAGFFLYQRRRQNSSREPAQKQLPVAPKITTTPMTAKPPATLYTLTITSDTKGSRAWLEKGILQTGEGENSALLGPGAPLGTLPITNLKFKPSLKQITIKVAAPTGKIVRHMIVPNRVYTLTADFQSPTASMTTPKKSADTRPSMHTPTAHKEPVMAEPTPMVAPAMTDPVISVQPLPMKPITPVMKPVMKPIMKPVMKPMNKEIKPGLNSGELIDVKL